MNVEDIKKTLAEIKRVSGDPEYAHGLEDELHVAVLTAIANGTCDDPVACAAEALKTEDIDFVRWYA